MLSKGRVVKVLLLHFISFLYIQTILHGKTSDNSLHSILLGKKYNIPSIVELRHYHLDLLFKKIQHFFQPINLDRVVNYYLITVNYFLNNMTNITWNIFIKTFKEWKILITTTVNVDYNTLVMKIHCSIQ